MEVKVGKVEMERDTKIKEVTTHTFAILRRL